MMTNEQNYINHIGVVIDASLSMRRRTQEVIKVVDDLIAYLARRSQELDQETRVTIYTFNDEAKCRIYEKDVLRLPSIAKMYNADGNTALLDATLLSQRDYALIPEKYGDHSFLTYVITDGEENVSAPNARYELIQLFKEQKDHWTIAVLVPDMNGVSEAKRFGFPKDNIAIWNTLSTGGFIEAGKRIQEATDAYMVSRASGVRGTRSLFSTGTDAVNKATVKAMGLKPLKPTEYTVFEIEEDSWFGLFGH